MINLKVEFTWIVLFIWKEHFTSFPDLNIVSRNHGHIIIVWSNHLLTVSFEDIRIIVVEYILLIPTVLLFESYLD